MSLTTDSNDPRLGHGVDEKPIPQHDVYLVLSEEERSKGFVRPVRSVYVHVGIQKSNPKSIKRKLTKEECERFSGLGYVIYEEYPKNENSTSIGRYWTQKELDNCGCGTETRMGLALAETYARNPQFYGSTYCVYCQMHRPVEEFVWKGTNERVGS